MEKFTGGFQNSLVAICILSNGCNSTIQRMQPVLRHFRPPITTNHWQWLTFTLSLAAIVILHLLRPLRPGLLLASMAFAIMLVAHIFWQTKNQATRDVCTLCICRIFRYCEFRICMQWAPYHAVHVTHSPQIMYPPVSMCATSRAEGGGRGETALQQINLN